MAEPSGDAGVGGGGEGRGEDREHARARRHEVEAWVASRNASGSTVQWHFTSADSRVMLSRLYPSILS